MKTKKALAVTAISIAVGAIGTMAFSSLGSTSQSSKEHLKLVKSATAFEVSTTKQKKYPGIIEEAEEVNLAFRVAGPIYKMYIKEGEYVKKGQLLAEMDPRDYEVQKNAIEAQVVQLQSEYSRVEELKNRQSVAENEFEKMKAGKEMAEAKLKNAIDQLNDTKLYAPFSGYITNVMFDKGELVNQGNPIASIVDISLLKVEVNVPASMYINKDAITKIECTQENIPGKTFPLTLFSHNIKANNNGLYKFYLYHAPNRGSKLVPGMNVSVTIQYAMQNDTLLSIPANALIEKDKNSFVWVIKDNRVRLREVKTNSQVRNGNIGITHGLRAGEQVVTAGLNLLSENEKVRVVSPPSKTNIGNLL